VPVNGGEGAGRRWCYIISHTSQMFARCFVSDCTCIGAVHRYSVVFTFCDTF